jgi:hypothetical protein
MVTLITKGISGNSMRIPGTSAPVSADTRNPLVSDFVDGKDHTAAT